MDPKHTRFEWKNLLTLTWPYSHRMIRIWTSQKVTRIWNFERLLLLSHVNLSKLWHANTSESWLYVKEWYFTMFWELLGVKSVSSLNMWKRLVKKGKQFLQLSPHPLPKWRWHSRSAKPEGIANWCSSTKDNLASVICGWLLKNSAETTRLFMQPEIMDNQKCLK